jgi:hypothetical protein
MHRVRAVLKDPIYLGAIVGVVAIHVAILVIVEGW